MAFYLLQASYTAQAWAAMVRNPFSVKNSSDNFVPPVVKALGGKVVGDHAWVAFGDYDVVAVIDMPDNVRAAAVSSAISATGRARAVKTTPLMEHKDAIKALKMAHDKRPK